MVCMYTFSACIRGTLLTSLLLSVSLHKIETVMLLLLCHFCVCIVSCVMYLCTLNIYDIQHAPLLTMKPFKMSEKQKTNQMPKI